MHSLELLLVMALNGLVTAQNPTSAGLGGQPSTTSSSLPTGDAACAYISHIRAASRYQPAEPVTVPAAVAYACLRAIPVNKDDALALVDSMLPYLQFQSTLTYLKNPPSGYPFDSIDIFQAMEGIRDDVLQGSFESEYDFQLGISNTLASAHDGHLSWNGDTSTNIRFRRPFWLASLSSDGNAFPLIYAYNHEYTALASTGELPPNIIAIDGQDPVDVLQSWPKNINAQDPDALYNANFMSLSPLSVPLLSNSVSVSGSHYPNASTTLSYSNGTNLTYDNQAVVTGDWTDIASGEAYYSKFCKGTPTPDIGGGTTTPSPDPATGIPAIGFPFPQIIHSQKLVAGYFLNDTGFENVAVLNIASFSAPQPLMQEFSTVVRNFLAMARAAKKTKLVIDIQSNPGGKVLLGYDTFIQLFPSISPYGGSNLRAHDGLSALGEGFAASDDGKMLSNLSRQYYDFPGNYQVDLTADGQNFTSWQDLYGPHQDSGDNFTSTFRKNLDPTFVKTYDDFDISTEQSDSIQPFLAEDIVILSNGLCASTCANFVEYMKQQGKVQSIAIGGRPQSGSQQTVGGARGSLEMPWLKIYHEWELLQSVLKEGSPSNVSQDLITQWNQSDIGNLSTYAIQRASNETTPVLNMQNALRLNDSSLLPLQFRYEAADCRLYYTPEMLLNITAVWRAAARSGFNDTSLCVQNSLNDPTSLSGNATLLNGTTPSSTSGTSPSASASPTSTNSTNAASSLIVGWPAFALGLVAIIASLL